MAKVSIKSQKSKKSSSEYSMKKIKKILSDNNACYVLLTCSDPTNDGKMEAEMSYNGDETLASYLIENAKEILNTDVCLENSC